MNYNPGLKRLLDFFVSAIALLILSPFFYFIILFIKVDSKGSAFFKQKRIGRNFKPFQLIKFRSMVVSENKGMQEFNPGDNSRVTRVGSFLRKAKIDELPELINVLRGDMSFVGPRPEVEKYIRIYPQDFKEILRTRPGISDDASIKYRDEEKILAMQNNPEWYYLQVILPDKLRLAKGYLRKISFSTDVDIIMKTLKRIVRE